MQEEPVSKTHILVNRVSRSNGSFHYIETFVTPLCTTDIAAVNYDPAVGGETRLCALSNRKLVHRREVNYASAAGITPEGINKPMKILLRSGTCTRRCEKGGGSVLKYVDFGPESTRFDSDHGREFSDEIDPTRFAAQPSVPDVVIASTATAAGGPRPARNSGGETSKV
ncbi:hypothetical protein EVAR_58894_1 [Eumeta japonica]|uniref:Uncharacterized protein n=1 Tax=Eumeta variegata TaxID=151549 RepID=A0A4C1YWG5_EUMVA|nr:hypothetical protein EVAR_58894_1 [Eumeta japonica]